MERPADLVKRVFQTGRLDSGADVEPGPLYDEDVGRSRLRFLKI